MSPSADAESRNPTTPRRGLPVLHGLLREHTHDLREIDFPDFRSWLALHLPRLQRDPTFAQRVRIRDLRRSCPALGALERRHRDAVAADSASPAFPRLSRVERKSAGIEKGIAGLAEAIDRRPAAARTALRKKLAAFRAAKRDLAEEWAALVRSSPERRALRRIETALRRLRERTGLAEEEATLARFLTARGRHGGRSGSSFEATAEEAVRRDVLPDVCRTRSPDGIALLRRVTLGTARAEFDLLLVRKPKRVDEEVEILAAVEAKRNINDLAHGFLRRQEDLAWLTGETDGLDPAVWRTKTFPTGRFDRAAVHDQDEKSFPIGPSSFRNFHRDGDTGRFLDRLYLVTRPGPIWGLSSAALGRISHRAATDERWAPDDEAYLRRFWKWCRGLCGDFESPDVLRLFATTARRSESIVLTE